jgi:hypothetical protein
MRQLFDLKRCVGQASRLRAGVGLTLGWFGAMGLSGWVGLAGLGGLKGGGGAARAEAMREPLTPQPSSLAPVDVEGFRQRYGQEALFRLKLGVEAGERSAAGPSGAAGRCAEGWTNSAQGRAFQAALAREQWYAAGEALGLWRRHCGSGSGAADEKRKEP